MTDPEHADCIYLAPEPEPPCYVEDDNQPTSSSASRYEEFVNLLDCPSPEDSEIEELFNLPIEEEEVLEEEATFFWISILAEIEGHANDLEFSFEDILIFVTGAADVPPMGFSPSPTLEFCDEIKYPTASTCTNVLTLPLNQAYEEFKDNFVFWHSEQPWFYALIVLLQLTCTPFYYYYS